MEEIRNQYLSLLSEIIAVESDLLGPDIAICKAKNIGGLVLDKNNNVIGIKGDENHILHLLVESYLDIAGQTAKDILEPIFRKYPLINI